MKNLAIILVIGLMFSLVNTVEAQKSNKEIRKTLKLKPPREVRKQAKEYEKKRSQE